MTTTEDPGTSGSKLHWLEYAQHLGLRTEPAWGRDQVRDYVRAELAEREITMAGASGPAPSPLTLVSDMTAEELDELVASALVDAELDEQGRTSLDEGAGPIAAPDPIVQPGPIAQPGPIGDYHTVVHYPGAGIAEVVADAAEAGLTEDELSPSLFAAFHRVRAEVLAAPVPDGKEAIVELSEALIPLGINQEVTYSPSDGSWRILIRQWDGYIETQLGQWLVIEPTAVGNRARLVSEEEMRASFVPV